MQQVAEDPESSQLLGDQNFVVRERQLLSTVRNVAHTVALVHLKHSPIQSLRSALSCAAHSIMGLCNILLCPYHYRCFELTSNDSGPLACGAMSLTLRQLMSYIYIYIYMEHLFLMFLDHTQRHTTVGRTPLDE